MSQAELVHDLTIQRDRALHWSDGLRTEQREQVLTAEGWRVQDFLGHLSFCEQQTLEQIGDTLKLGRPTPMPPDSKIDDVNERGAVLRKDWTWERIRAEFENTRTALIQRVSELDAGMLGFYVPSPWVGDSRIVSLEALIREDVLQHTAGHLEELEQKLA